MNTDQPSPNYRSEFLKSPHHIWLGILTLGLGFLSAHALPLILGVTLFALGWIYIPDLPFFRGWVDRRQEAAKRAVALAQVADFVKRRDALLSSLSPSRRDRYATLAEVCHDIEKSSAENPAAFTDPATDPRLRKLDELMWTFLRLLSIEESLERFLEIERRENVPQIVQDAEQEAKRLSADVDAVQAKGGGPALETKQRYLGSRLERLDVLRKRLQRIDEAKENLALVRAEEDRLDQQIKLIRADAVATRNAETLTARIDASVEHLDQTNKWLSEMEEFKDVVGDMPATDVRVGYETAVASPPMVNQSPPPQRVRGKDQAARQ